MKHKHFYLRYLVYLLLALCCCAGGALYYAIHNSCVTFVPQHILPCHDSVLLDDEGVEWARLQRYQQEYVPLQGVPQHLIHAFLATEDRQFYEHIGISWYGIIRSLIYNIIYRRFAQGASTITQQMVRLLMGDNKKTLQRKIKEQLLSLIIEQQWSKEQILETYLNNLYFGCGIYGIRAAAQRFWSKRPAELTLEESAILAGIVKNPNTYCPLTNPLNALQRRNVVLTSMEQAGYITTETQYSLQQLPLTTVQSDTNECCAPHARDAIRQQLETTLGRNILYRGGLTIKTTLNCTMQQHAQLCFKGSIEQLRTLKAINPAINGALVCLKVDTGEIKALVGGYDYKNSQFNRATQAYRQLGSIFKPILYAIALEKGKTLAEIAYDEPLHIIDNNSLWEPHNVTKAFDGPMTLARALIRSNNIIAIKTIYQLGTDLVCSYAQQSGLPAPCAYPSLALGCIDATACEAAGMFNILANKGVYVEPHLIEWVKDASGTIIWQARSQKRRLFQWKTSSTILHLLEQAVQQSLSYLGLAPLSCTCAGKTGTTNEARNCWFAGSTPNYTTAIYLGADDNKPLGTIYSLRSTFPLWVSFNKLIRQPISHFSYDPALQPIIIDQITGQTLEKQTPHSLSLLQDTRTKAYVNDQLQTGGPSSTPQGCVAQQPEHWLPDDA